MAQSSRLICRIRVKKTQETHRLYTALPAPGDINRLKKLIINTPIACYTVRLGIKTGMNTYVRA